MPKTKKEFSIEQELEITSAKQALTLHKKLTSRWSSETALSQKLMIQIVKLLEEQNDLLYQIAKRKPVQPKFNFWKWITRQAQ